MSCSLLHLNGDVGACNLLVLGDMLLLLLLVVLVLLLPPLVLLLFGGETPGVLLVAVAVVFTPLAEHTLRNVDLLLLIYSLWHIQCQALIAVSAVPLYCCMAQVV
mgnify:CR=1 FL=1